MAGARRRILSLRSAAGALLALALAWGPVSAGTEAVAEGGAGRPVAIAAELSVDGPATRLVVTLSRPVKARAFLLEGPDRAVIELPDVNFQLPAEAGRRRVGLVSAFRSGLAAAGRSRIVVDLAAPALVDSVEVGPAPVPGATLLTVSFSRADRAAFRASAGTATSLDVVTTGSIGRRERDRRPLVAIDAGHGGADLGALSVGGLQEKDVTLAFAQALRERLEAGGRVRTRPDP